MANETNRSPLNQFNLTGRLTSSQRQQTNNMFANSLFGTINNQISKNQQPQKTQLMSDPTFRSNTSANPIVKNQMAQVPINPKAVGNPNTVKAIYGSENPNTFTKSVQNNTSPVMQMQNQTTQMADLTAQQDMAQMPPQGVQTSVTPTLGFEND